MESTFSVKEKQRTTLKAFLGGKYVSALIPSGFSKSLIYQLYKQMLLPQTDRIDEYKISAAHPYLAKLRFIT